MNQLQRHMLEYMSEVLHQEDIFFSEAWAIVESYVMDALGNTSQNVQEPQRYSFKIFYGEWEGAYVGGVEDVNGEYIKIK